MVYQIKPDHPDFADVPAINDAIAQMVDRALGGTGWRTGSGTGFSGSYNDLTDKPTLGTAAAQDSGAFATAAQGTKADTAVQSDVVQANGGEAIGNLVVISETDHDALIAAGTADPNTGYLRYVETV